jgi:hypothetical protein
MSNLSIKPWMIVAGVGVVVLICGIGILTSVAINQIVNPTSSSLFSTLTGTNPASVSFNSSPRFSSRLFPLESQVADSSCAWSEDGNYQTDCYQEKSWGQGGMMQRGGMMGHRGGGGDRWRAKTQLNPTIVQPTPDAQISFQQDVFPIFETYCISCHGNQAGLSLETYSNVIKGSNHGAVVIPGDPLQSQLIRFVSSGFMPYGGPPLSQEQIQVLVNWVASGALDD